jgi:hypothetical protein
LSEGGQLMSDISYYATPGSMTVLPGFDEALTGMPTDPIAVAATVQGLIIHPFWADAYGVEIAAERQDDVQVRPASAIIERILELAPGPLVEPRGLDRRFAGNCRHFSVLTVALLRRAGVPSRARCGFAGYFEPGKWVDHWVVEYWDGGRWVTLDPQIDELQRRLIGLAEDPADLPPGRFVPAGEAWLRCQAGEENSDRFGILDMWGQWFIKANVGRDLAALNKVEMLPWDGWGRLMGEGASDRDDAYVDEIASLTISGDHADIRSRYQRDDDLRVPTRVVSFFTAAGPVEVEVAEWV